MNTQATTQTAGVLTPGFVDPVHDAQRVFRSVLEATARPLQPQPIDVDLSPPQPLALETGAVLLALCDEQTPIWLGGSLSGSEEVVTWVRFHTGARLVQDPAHALFCFAASADELPDLSELNPGTDEEPHLSATVLVHTAVRQEKPQPGPTGSEAGTAGYSAQGPGIRQRRHWDGAGVPQNFLEARSQQAQSFPRGIDLLITAPGTVSGLPRSTTLTALAGSPDNAQKEEA